MLSVSKCDPARSAPGNKVGDGIRLDAGDFARLSTACLSEIEARFH